MNKRRLISVKHYFDLWNLRKSKLQQLRSLLIIYFRFVTESAAIFHSGYVNCFVVTFTEIQKVLTKIGKESNCKHINPWICPCENHLS